MVLRTGEAGRLAGGVGFDESDIARSGDASGD